MSKFNTILVCKRIKDTQFKCLSFNHVNQKQQNASTPFPLYLETHLKALHQMQNPVTKTQNQSLFWVQTSWSTV